MTLTFQTNSGDKRTLPASEINDFAASMRGRLVRRDAADYDEVRQIWNAMIERRPALIARCQGTGDVITAVKFAAKHDMLMSTRGGGHNIAGSALCDDGLTIDLSPM